MIESHQIDWDEIRRTAPSSKDKKLLPGTYGPPPDADISSPEAQLGPSTSSDKSDIENQQFARAIAKINKNAHPKRLAQVLKREAKHNKQ